MKHLNNPIVYLAFQVIPRSKDEKNFELVDKALEVVKNAKIPYQIGAMETTMKGPLNLLFEIVKSAQQACLDNGAIEVITNVKIHTTSMLLDDSFCTYEF